MTKERKKRSIKKNYILNLTYQILTLLIPLVTTPYLSRVLEADGTGQYSFMYSVVTYFILVATLGTLSYGQREISYVQDEVELRSKVFFSIEIVSCISTAIVLIVFGLFTYFQKTNQIYYLVFSLNILAVAFDISWFFQGLEEFGIIVSRNIFFKLLTLLFIFTLVKDKSDLLIYIAGTSILTLASAVSLWTYIPKYICKVSMHELKLIETFKGTLLLFVPAIATSVYTVLDKTMIGLITESDYENGYYEQATKISKVAIALISSFATVMMPRIGYYYNKHDYKSVNTYMLKSYRFMWFLSVPMCFGLIGITRSFVPWFYGPGFEKEYELLPVVSLLTIAIGISTITGSQYLVPTKRQKEFNTSIIAGSVINVILNIFLIPRFMSIGAAIASVIAETAISVIQLTYVKNEIDLSLILKSSSKYFVSAVIMLGYLLLIGNKLGTTAMSTLIMIVTGGVLYILLLIVFKDILVLELINSVKGKLVKRKNEH